MKHTIFKLVLDFEKEEKWLNELSAKGLHMIHYGFPGRYVFEEGKPGEYIYRLELLENLPSQAESKVYLSFIEESGAEVVATFGRWVYFRKEAADGPFDVYTDSKSRYNHYKRIVTLLGIFSVINIGNGLNQLISGLRLGLDFSIIVGVLCLTVGSALTALTVSYLLKMRRLNRDAEVFE